MSDPFQLTKAEQHAVSTNSIERVINTTLKLLDKLPDHHEDVGINKQDWYDLKPLVTKLWNRERDDLLRVSENLPPRTKDLSDETYNLLVEYLTEGNSVEDLAAQLIDKMHRYEIDRILDWVRKGQG